MITAYHNGTRIMLFDEVASELNIRNGQHLNHDVLMRAIRDNAAMGIAKCTIEIARRSPPIGE